LQLKISRIERDGYVAIGSVATTIPTGTSKEVILSKFIGASTGWLILEEVAGTISFYQLPDSSMPILTKVNSYTYQI